MTKKALPHLQEGSAIINTTSITAYEGDTALIDYSSTKGAIVSFTRSMAKSLADKGIRVNAVALRSDLDTAYSTTFPEEKVKQHGLDTPMGRPGQLRLSMQAPMFCWRLTNLPI
nr:SDR family oxidoreductase [Bacillus subtilis]